MESCHAAAGAGRTATGSAQPLRWWRPRALYAAAFRLQHLVADPARALARYCELIETFPDSTEARYARIHVRNILRGRNGRHAARLPALGNEALGHWLGQRVRTGGRFVTVRVPGVYDTTQALATFFRAQRNEWIAVCMLDAELTCRLIWLNECGSRDEVTSRFGVETFVHRVSPFAGASNILVAHNHPVPLAGRLRRPSTARATRHTLERLSAFSEVDRRGSRAWRGYCRANGLGYAEALCVGRNILIEGDRALVDDWRAHRCPPRSRLLALLAPLARARRSPARPQP